MSIQKKVLLILAGAILGLVVFLYLASNLIVLQGFAQVEEQQTQQNVQRGRDAFSDDVNKLSTTAADYAGWDDTYAFIANGSQDYIASNFQPDNWKRNSSYASRPTSS